MLTETWGAVAVATGMWVIASVAYVGGEAPAVRSDGTVWTASSSDKVASHPTLVRRSLPGTPALVRIADLRVR
jgi:hypothetical protein